MSVDRRAAESLLSFWTDAGVDTAYGEAAVDRMAARATPTPRLARPELAPPSPKPFSHAISALGRDLAWAAADLDALAAAITAFDGCDLKTQGARQAVFGRGSADAAVMVIGEGPGADEDAQGAPFVGRAGRLLDKMLAAAGLEGRVFITNTVFWRPPGNRTPTAEEQLACAPFLERAIDLVRPNILLLVGAAAAKALLDRSEGILALRGRWFEWRANTIDLEVPALPTLHPAFLLRQPAAKKKVWQDLLLLAERVDRSERPD
jgi:DNA polymerase